MKSKLVAVIAALVVVVAVVAVALVIGLGGGGEDDDAGDPEAAPTETESSDPSVATDPNDPAFKSALSEPVEDSVYPNVGEPIVDALHYDLDLEWDPDASMLTGSAAIAFRATATQSQFQLDLGKALEVEAVLVDGEGAEFQHTGKDLVVNAPVTEDQKYLVEIDYAGTPEPADAPTTRSDFDTIGFTITEEGEAWTMQEPYGAFTWYPVNDQPSDKALYDFTITTPDPMVGVANGELIDRSEEDGKTVTEWHLATPAASYLTTIAIGEYEMTEGESDSGVPLTYWTPVDQPQAKESLGYTVEAMAWLEKRLGAYPYDRLGSVVVPSESAMETQTMITYGNTDYTLSPATVIHEIAHHWYGNTVSPTDWADVWMNEGMTMYLQGVFEAEQAGVPLKTVLDGWAIYERQSRNQHGPPGDYDPTTFAESNIYMGPALMWHELRQRIGDEAFWSMAKKWPTMNKDGNATREEYLAWVEKETGKELSSFFDDWLLGKRTPKRS